ncbi:unnamed protein product [Lathyrus oleraceus]
MKNLAWNCRGLGKPQTTKALKHLIRLHSPNILFLSETTKNNNDTCFNKLARIESLTNVFSISSSSRNETGRAGGLALIWSDNFNLYINDSIKNYIDFYIMAHNNLIDKNDNDNILWRGAAIYGYPKSNKKSLTCNMITNMA